MKISLFLALSLASFTSFAADFFVDVDSNGFTPASQQIQVGDTVTWINQDDFTHDITSNNQAWTRGFLFSMGETFTLQFTRTGTFGYRSVQDGISGTIIVVPATASNAPPSVTITSPLAGDVFNGTNSIIIAATATDDNAVSSVEFYVDGTLVGSATASPYTVTNKFAPGNYTLTAAARDGAGLSATSAPISIVVRHLVTYQNFSFTPSTFTVRLGESVIFTNRQGSHSVTGYDAEPFCGPALGTIGATCLVTFNSPGNFRYRCVPHSTPIAGGYSGMVGAIKVLSGPEVRLTAPAFSGGDFTFQVDGLVVGKTNVIQLSSGLNAWTSVVTNVATNSSITFREPNATSPFQFYRVLQLP